MPMLAIGAALGAALAYFFDPQNGKRRRHMTRDRTAAFFRKRGRRVARGVAADVYGVAQKATHLREERKDLDDVTLARKVETELFRPAHVPKGSINVSVVGGVVELRGEVDRLELVDELVEKARSVQGVQDVKNLLHLPHASAPTRK